AHRDYRPRRRYQVRAVVRRICARAGLRARTDGALAALRAAPCGQLRRDEYLDDGRLLDRADPARTDGQLRERYPAPWLRLDAAQPRHHGSFVLEQGGAAESVPRRSLDQE